MDAADEAYRSPYTPTPGGSVPGPEGTAAEGRAELWTFFWVTVASVVIIAAFGIGAWLYWHYVLH